MPAFALITFFVWLCQMTNRNNNNNNNSSAAASTSAAARNIKPLSAAATTISKASVPQSKVKQLMAKNQSPTPPANQSVAGNGAAKVATPRTKATKPEASFASSIKSKPATTATSILSSPPPNSTSSTSSDPPKTATKTLSDAPPAVVSPDPHSPFREGIKEVTAAPPGKIKHAAQLLPEDEEGGIILNCKKREFLGINSSYFSANKRRRCDVEIQRPNTTNHDTKKKIPDPPNNGPPKPTQYLKVLLLGPPKLGKTEWIMGRQATTSSSASSSSPFAVDYFSKDYSFESSSSVQETVRLHLYNADCTVDDTPPACWNYSLLPSVQHIVLVLDLWNFPEDSTMEKKQEEALESWKMWLDRNMGSSNICCSDKNPVMSLVLIDSRQLQEQQQQKDSDSQMKPATLAEWHRLGATVNRVCRNWPRMKNKWYMMEEQESSSDIIVQTLIERSWSGQPSKLQPPQQTKSTSTSHNGGLEPPNKGDSKTTTKVGVSADINEKEKVPTFPKPVASSATSTARPGNETSKNKPSKGIAVSS